MLVLLAAPLAAHAVAPDQIATDTISLPEPETLSLMAIGALVLFLSAKRKR